MRRIRRLTFPSTVSLDLSTPQSPVSQVRVNACIATHGCGRSITKPRWHVKDDMDPTIATRYPLSATTSWSLCNVENGPSGSIEFFEDANSTKFVNVPQFVPGISTPSRSHGRQFIPLSYFVVRLLHTYSHGTIVAGERQRPAGVCFMGDERGRATGEAEGVGCGVLPWATSGAGPQAKPKASAVGQFYPTHQDRPTGR